MFRVTAPVLRIAQGQVRCGVCDTSFDALRYLSDDVELDVNAASASRIAGAPDTRTAAPPPAPAASPAPTAPTAGSGGATRHRPSADEERELGAIAAELARGAARTRDAAPPASTPVPAPAMAAAEPEENVLEPADVEDIVLEATPEPEIPDAALEFNLPADSWDQVFVKDPTATVTPLDLDLAASRASAEPFEAPDELTILETGDDPLARTDEFPQPDFTDVELEPEALGPVATAAAESPAAAAQPEVAAGPPLAPAATSSPEFTPWIPHERPPPPVAPVDVDFRERAPPAEPEPGPPPGRRIAAMAAAIALSLALLAQVVNHYREALADSPMLGPALASLYARFGLPLEPNWDLTAFDVRQWGAQSEEVAGVLTLRASIVNKAARSQPYPLLRVTLEDRFGSRVGRREFTPAEYLPGRAQPRSLLASGARADADLKLADPGNQAVGFELDVCLARHGVLLCGADAKAGT
ncbi:MAG: DUF3426 domain-containing protein [Proteobacteria bacterium]|nr:DUF3426 domain-containing protein [Pseudomonadota bacterium]